MTDAGEQPNMPSVDLPYLIGYLFDVGPTMAGAMGDAPLSYGELQSWQHLSGVDLTPWEVRLMRKLSTDYLVQLQKSEKPECPPPFGGWDRDAVARKIDEIFG